MAKYTHIVIAIGLSLTSITTGRADVSDHWGAIAYGPGGVYGMSLFRPTKTDAVSRAHGACGDACTNSITIYYQCAALAVGDAGHATAWRDRYLERAKLLALRRCNKADRQCRIRLTACTHRH